MSSPRDVVRSIEQGDLPIGQEERFIGYGVMSAPFATGHILCLRRFAHTSIGPGYTSVWYRDPDSRWSFYQDAPPELACPRYFGNALAGIYVRDVAIDWTGPNSFSVRVSGGTDLRWDVDLAATPATTVLNAISARVPDGLWRSPAFLKLMAALAGPALGAGRLRLAGRSPNGQSFVANPRLVWTIPSSRAVLNGADLGPSGWSRPQDRLGDFWIPARGLFAVGRAFFEPFDPTRHRPLPVETEGALPVGDSGRGASD